MHIVLFGGAFDPPHLGHQNITRALLEQKLADEVWYVPVGEHHFGKKMASAEDRVAMLQLVLDDPRVKIERYEIDTAGISYTHKTLEALSAQYPEHHFSWIIGSDNLPSFHKWGDYQALLKEFPFYVYPRKDFPMQPLYEGMTPLQQVPEVAISSTDVRAALRAAHPITNLVDPQVAEYIKQKGLYVTPAPAT
jgi:nicotinate-nucleotide adenylyltransferase